MLRVYGLTLTLTLGLTLRVLCGLGPRSSTNEVAGLLIGKYASTAYGVAERFRLRYSPIFYVKAGLPPFLCQMLRV